MKLSIRFEWKVFRFCLRFTVWLEPPRAEMQLFPRVRGI